MSLIEYQLDKKIDKVRMAVDRVRLANLSKEPLYVCYSGGKDSKVLRRICEIWWVYSQGRNVADDNQINLQELMGDE